MQVGSRMVLSLVAMMLVRCWLCLLLVQVDACSFICPLDWLARDALDWYPGGCNNWSLLLNLLLSAVTRLWSWLWNGTWSWLWRWLWLTLLSNTWNYWNYDWWVWIDPLTWLLPLFFNLILNDLMFLKEKTVS